jgi:diamine N-acetyltransferase
LVRIRKATAADAELLSSLARTTFLDTFGAQNKPEDVEKHVASRYSTQIQREELADRTLTYLIAEVDGVPAGFAMIGLPRSESCSNFESPIELFRFYVDLRWHGQGVAAPLMEACYAEARLRSGRTICLSVWEYNPRAIRFYEKAGYVKSGTQPYLLGDDLQTDWVMTREIPL